MKNCNPHSVTSTFLHGRPLLCIRSHGLLALFSFVLITHRGVTQSKNTLKRIPFSFSQSFFCFLHLYHIYSPTGNKELTEIWHGLILFWFKELTDCHQEATILRPNDSTLLSSAFIRGESLYSLALRTGGRDLKLDGAQWFHCIDDWNTNDSGTCGLCYSRAGWPLYH